MGDFKIIKSTNGTDIKVNSDTYVWAKYFTWKVNSDGYAVCGKSPDRNMLMHRVITDCPDNMQVDHINGEKLDNTRENLRIVTAHQNSMNRRINSNSNTGYKGVYWHKRDKKFVVVVKFHGKKYFSGRFNNAEEAHEAYMRKSKELFGDYANDGFRSLKGVDLCTAAGIPTTTEEV